MPSAGLFLWRPAGLCRSHWAPLPAAPAYTVVSAGRLPPACGGAFPGPSVPSAPACAADPAAPFAPAGITTNTASAALADFAGSPLLPPGSRPPAPLIPLRRRCSWWRCRSFWRGRLCWRSSFRRDAAVCLRWSPSGSFCSFCSFCSCCSCLRRIPLCCPRSSCRLRILLSPQLRSFRRDVAVLGGVADSSGPAALVSIAVRLGRGSWNFCKFRKPFCSR